VRYRCYGATISSEVPLGLQQGGDEPDVEVRRRSVAEPPGPARTLRLGTDGRLVRWKVNVAAATATFWFEDAGTFRVLSDERAIDVDQRGPEQQMVRYLLVTGLSAAFSAMGRLVLHGGAVVGPHGAVAVCGPSGRGKSTTVLGLSRAGFGVLHDDLTVLTPDFTAHPGPRHASVAPATAMCLGVQGTADDDGKVAVALPDAPPSRLGAVLMLDARGREPALRRLSPRDAAVRLGKEAGLWFLLTSAARRTRFDLLTRLAEELPCYSWSAPMGIEQAAAAAAGIVPELVSV